MARCAVVNAIANLSAAPFIVMKGFAPKSSTTRNGLLLDSPETFLCHSESSPLMRLARLKASSDIRATFFLRLQGIKPSKATHLLAHFHI